MRSDVLEWAAGRPTGKLITKETLNHRGLIEMVSGLDVYQHTPEAYRRARAGAGGPDSLAEHTGRGLAPRPRSFPLPRSPFITREGGCLPYYAKGPVL